jgi:hypothetical protein
MRLLNIKTLKLESYDNVDNTPPYAILSHTWGVEEVLFDDLQEQSHSNDLLDLQSRFDDLERRFDELKSCLDLCKTNTVPRGTESTVSQPEKRGENEREPKDRIGSEDLRAKRKRGWSKIDGCCSEALKFELGYVWIDTCCIYKESSSELSEAINSMFDWYRRAVVCFAYLGDASDVDDAFGLKPSNHSRWFDRGWTLQELIAPINLLFYQQDWKLLGQRSSFTDLIEKITTVPRNVLAKEPGTELHNFSVARRLSWAVRRRTTRSEDRAYSLMGLFNVNMPTIYGEGGPSAFFRLQAEIFRISGDHSIFAWTVPCDNAELSDLPPHNLFALDPDWFEPFSERVYPKHSHRPDMKPNIKCVPYEHHRPGMKPGMVYFPSAIPGPNVGVDEYPTYSGACHGIRVQMLLERRRSSIWFAHLACGFTDTNECVGIYLFSKQRGNYQRYHPDRLVSIPLLVHQDTPLKVYDVYITNTQLKLQNMSSSDRNPHVRFCINLDKKLEQSGFTVSDYTPSDWRLCTDRRLELGDLEFAVVFRSLTSPWFGVVIRTNRSYVVSVRIVPDLNSNPEGDITAVGLLQTSRGELQSHDILERDMHVFIGPSGNGKRAIVKFYRHGFIESTWLISISIYNSTT